MKYNLLWAILVAVLIFAARATAAEQGVETDYQEDLPPILAFFALVMLLAIGVGAAACAVIGTVLALFALVMTFVLVTLGIVSLSTVVAIVRGRLSAGFRALHYQLFIACAWPCGIGVMWVAQWILHAQMGRRDVVLLGSLLGIAFGALLAGMLDWSGRWLYRKLWPVKPVGDAVA
jgi:hypothetical protein